MALYNSRGNIRVTVDDTTMPFGIYAADGSLRVTVVDGTTRTGLYAADGSFNVVGVDATDLPISIYHPCGALRGVATSDEEGITAPNGAIYMDGLTTLEILYSALSFDVTDQPYTIEGAELISLTDSDNAGGTYGLSLSLPGGTLTLSQTTGLSITSGANGSTAVAFTGSLADILAAIDGLVVDDGEFPGSEIEITFSHAATSQSVTRSVPINLTSAPFFTVEPTITGIPQLANTLSVSLGTVSGTEPISYTYQWLEDGVDISGATTDQWFVASVVGGEEITVEVTATNAIGSTMTTTVAVVIEAAPVNITLPVISGTPQNGATFTLDSPGTWNGPAPVFTYQWRVNGAPVSGATSSSWVSTGLVVTDDVSCRVTATNDEGSAFADSNSIPISNLSIEAPSSISIDETDQPETFSINFTDLDAQPGDTYRVELELPNGTMTLGSGFGSLGLTFTVGDGTDDDAMTFEDVLNDLISAVTNMSFDGLEAGETPLGITFTEVGSDDSVALYIPITVSDIPAGALYHNTTSHYLLHDTNYLTHA